MNSQFFTANEIKIEIQQLCENSKISGKFMLLLFFQRFQPFKAIQNSFASNVCQQLVRSVI